MYDILYKGTSSGDVGTMCSNMNAVNQVNAKTKNVLDNLNYCKSFVKLESAAFIVAAALQYFSMTDITDEVPEHFALPAVTSGNKGERRLWLHQHVKTILEKFVMTEQEQYFATVQATVNELNRYSCSVCGKNYKYRKAMINHEKKIHELQHDVDPPTATPSVQQKAVDSCFNYACTSLSLGMFLFNFDDAVKEGDGERVMRCWKFMMLIFKPMVTQNMLLLHFKCKYLLRHAMC